MATYTKTLDPVALETFLREMNEAWQQRTSFMRGRVNTSGMSQGNTVHWRKMGAIGEPQPKARGGLIHIEGVTYESKTAVAEQFGLGVYEDRLDEVIAGAEDRAALQNGLLYSRERHIDKRIIDTMVAEAGAQLVDTANPISLDHVRKLKAYWDRVHAPDEGRTVLLSEGVFSDLMLIPQFSTAEWTDLRNFNGEKLTNRRWMGIDWVQIHSSLLPVPAANARTCIAFSRPAVGFYELWTGDIQVGFQQDRNSWLLSYVTLNATKVLRPEGVVLIKVAEPVANGVTTI